MTGRGAGSGIRTRTTSRSAHFECAASAISPPRPLVVQAASVPQRQRPGRHRPVLS